MKFIYFFNLTAVVIAGALMAPVLWDGDFSLGLMAALYLGAFQVFLGVVMVLFNLRNRLLWVYLTATAVFFILIPQVVIWILPPLLACYFTYILHLRTFKTGL